MRAYHFFKRLEDIAFSLCFIIVFSPLYAGVALVSYFSGLRPVIFRQTRAGLNGKPFTIYKFTSMTDERGEDGKLLPDSKRLTPFGRFLRKSSIDELPQFANILKGEMSLVGPRPLLVEYNANYSPEHALRLTVKPGVTGLAQISGRSAIKWSQKFDADVRYVKSASFWQDQKILFLSFYKVLASVNSPAAIDDIRQIDDINLYGRSFGKNEAGGARDADGKTR